LLGAARTPHGHAYYAAFVTSHYVNYFQSLIIAPFTSESRVSSPNFAMMMAEPPMSFEHQQCLRKHAIKQLYFADMLIFAAASEKR